MLVLTVAPVSIHSNANQYPVLVPFGTSTQYPVLTGCWRENLHLVHDLEITGLRKLNLLYSGCSLGAIATDPAWTNDRPSGIACSSSKQDISRSGPGMPRDERYAAETFFKAALYFWCKLGCFAIERFGGDWLAKSFAFAWSHLWNLSYFDIARTALSITPATSFGCET